MAEDADQPYPPPLKDEISPDSDSRFRFGLPDHRFESRAEAGEFIGSNVKPGEIVGDNVVASLLYMMGKEGSTDAGARAAERVSTWLRRPGETAEDAWERLRGVADAVWLLVEKAKSNNLAQIPKVVGILRNLDNQTKVLANYAATVQGWIAHWAEFDRFEWFHTWEGRDKRAQICWQVQQALMEIDPAFSGRISDDTIEAGLVQAARKDNERVSPFQIAAEWAAAAGAFPALGADVKKIRSRLEQESSRAASRTHLQSV